MPPILVVCTGNVCRSPLAVGFLQAALAGRFGSRAPVVSSAGTAGWEGSPAVPESVDAAAERGVDISDHRARALLRGHIDEAGVILGMAAEHRNTVLNAVPQAADRTFTLKELVRLLEALPPADPSAAPVLALKTRVAAAARLRAGGFQGNPNDEDVADPLGEPFDTFRAVAWEVDEWSGRLADGLFGLAPAHAAAGEEG